jgi:hypothetical protein
MRMRMRLPPCPSLPTPVPWVKEVRAYNIACIYNIEHVRHIQQQRQQQLHPLQMLRQLQEVHVLERRCMR